ncbi:MAG: helix-turn-helix domain-containing protein [Geminicoccales bacterium]
MKEIRYDDIGGRLKAYRLGRNLSVDDLAERIGVSRAALYRYEKGQPPKLEVLELIANELGVSLPSLLGVGVEYIPSALGFLERLRQIEEDSTQLVVLFGPVPYLLTSPEYDELLPTVLRESLPDGVGNREVADRTVDDIMRVLKRRKETFAARRPSVVAVLSLAEVEQFLINGFIGRTGLPKSVQKDRYAFAAREIARVTGLIRAQPMGLQIGVLVDARPTSTFQILRQRRRRVLALSPFRLGDMPNLRIGVAMVTYAPEAVELHQKVADELWARAAKGEKAAALLERALSTVAEES